MRIAIVKLSALGDIVHAMIVLQFIKKFNNEILIDWIVDEGFIELLDPHPQINNIHVVNLKKAKKDKSVSTLFKEFKKIRQLDSYDLVIDMQGLVKSAIISKLIPSKKVVGFDKFSNRELLASVFYNKTFFCSYNKNVIERNIELVEFALGLRVSKKQILNKLPIIYFKEKIMNSYLSKTKKNILLVPGASYSSKCYPVKKIAKLSSLVDANFLITWGSQEEKELSLQIKELSPKVSICEKLSIGLLASLISEVDLVIGADTGPTHMAWALNIPSITLFGPTPGYRNTYTTKINKVIESESVVNPKKINKNDYSINNIKVEYVIKVATELLNG
jgi:heptosyltransferase I